MATIRLENGSDVIDLDEQWGSGLGYQSHAGATGLGLPDAEVQWFEGAGSGAVYRGRRVQSREIDLPISILTRDKQDLVARLDRLTMMLSAPFRIVRVDDEGERWVLEAVHAGGADYTTGVDTDGATEWHATLQLRSGWHTWRREGADNVALSPEPEGGEFPYGQITMENIGSADTWPVFKVQGPGNNFEVRDPDGYGFKWTGSLSAGETLFIHTESGRVVDHTGANRYGSLAAAPRMMPLKPGLNTMTVTMDGKATGPGGAALVKDGTTPTATNWFPRPEELAVAGSEINVRSNLCPNPRGGTTWGWAVEQYTTRGEVFVEGRLSSMPNHWPTPNRGENGGYTRGGCTKAHPNGTNFILLSPNCVNPGGAVTLSCWVKTRLTVQAIRPVVRSSTTFSGTTTVREDTYPYVVPPRRAGEWVKVSMTVHDFPGAYIRMAIRVNNATVNDWVDMTEVLVEPVPEERNYFDGGFGGLDAEITYGTSRKWTSTANQSASHLVAPAATGWSASGYAKVWKWANAIAFMSCGDSGKITGPNVAHTSGTPWVGTVTPVVIGKWKGKVGARFSIQSATTNAVAARSPVRYPTNSTQSSRLSAAGGGALIKDSTTNVRPVVEFFDSGVGTLGHLSMQKSTNPMGYFDGDTTNNINHGYFEWAGTPGNSVSHRYPVKWERASLTTVEYQPRRWAVL